MHLHLQRRHALIAALAALAAPAAFAQAGDEAALRETIARFQQAWNARDIAAWEQLVTDDVLLQETYYHTAESRQINNRERSRPQFENNFKSFDLDWTVQRIKLLPEGRAIAVMTLRQHALPRGADGRYAASFTTDPAITRWRLEGGRWRLAHLVTHQAYAREIVSKEGL
jgi:ketosteroid isomerase-like protein